MSAILALVMKFLPLLVTAAQDIPELIGFISGLEAIFKRTAVWTDAQKADFDAQTAAMRSDPAWQITD